MKTLAHLKREILQEHLWSYLRIRPRVQAVEAFSENLTEASEFLAGRPSPTPLTASKHIEYLRRYPELLEGPREAVVDWARATSIIMDRKEESLRRLDEIARILIRKQLPTHTPARLQIPATELDRFATQFDWKSVPLLALEGALYASELTWHGKLDEGDAVDIQYLSVALMCCDLVVVDKRMVELARRASAGLSFRMATVQKGPRELLSL
jgi:hypothetical protein